MKPLREGSTQREYADYVRRLGKRVGFLEWVMAAQGLFVISLVLLAELFFR